MVIWWLESMMTVNTQDPVRQAESGPKLHTFCNMPGNVEALRFAFPYEVSSMTSDRGVLPHWICARPCAMSRERTRTNAMANVLTGVTIPVY
jgi:hypothetical protein